MCKSSDGLHFDSVSLIQWVIKDSRSVDDLPSRVLVVSMANEKALCRKRIRLHIHIGVGHVIYETGLADIGITGEDECSLVCVDGWESAEMLSDLLKIAERRLEFFNKSAHSTESRSLQLFAPVKGISIFE